jgi:hypothetical protein
MPVFYKFLGFFDPPKGASAGLRDEANGRGSQKLRRFFATQPKTQGPTTRQNRPGNPPPLRYGAFWSPDGVSGAPRGLNRILEAAGEANAPANAPATTWLLTAWSSSRGEWV